jgi:phosphoglycolate phosphatase-like HAD superfamily hydrolase
MHFLILNLFFCFLIFISLEAQNPLASWNENYSKEKILSFVNQISDSQSSSFIALEDRIAVIDHDGTLWCEKPHYTQATYILKKIEDLLPFKADWIANHPLRTIATDHPTFHGLMELSLVTHSGLSLSELTQSVREFIFKAIHPRFGVTYNQTVYQPMIELIHFLYQNGFKIYIVSGGGVEFIRAFSESIYQIPVECVIGSSLQTWYVGEPIPHLVLVPNLVLPLNNSSGKPVNIERFIGKIPVLAIGNSDGDIEMLQYIQQPNRLSLSILIHHDDGEREYQYDEGAKKILELCEQNSQWLKVSMKNDFKSVFPSTLNN